MSQGALTLQIDGPIVHAKFQGEIDLSNVNELREELTGATPNEAVGLVFDLSDVDYVDSAGLRLIQQLREDLRARRQRLQLVIPDGSVILDVVRLAGLDWHEEITGNVETGRRTLDP
jgi:anti-anti-sigma factor